MNGRTPPAAEDLSFLMARANAMTLQLAVAKMRPFGMTPRSYAVLVLALEGEPRSQREIADYLKMDPSRVVGLIDGLQSRGFVERVPDPRDRRLNQIVATEQGAQFFAETRALVRDSEEAAFARLTEREREALRQLLTRLVGQ